MDSNQRKLTLADLQFVESLPIQPPTENWPSQISTHLQGAAGATHERRRPETEISVDSASIWQGILFPARSNERN